MHLSDSLINIQLKDSYTNEELILGMLINNSNYLQLAPELKPRDFELPSHQVLFTTILELNKSGIEIESNSIADHLQQKGRLEDVGGLAEIVDLENETFLFREEDFRFHTELCRQESLLAKNIDLCSNVSNLSEIADDANGTSQQLINLDQIELLPNAKVTLEKKISSNNHPVLDKTAYYGLAGDIVLTVEPHSESDPVAILLQFIVAFGNIIGRGAHFKVEASYHYLNLYIVVVGASAKSRKGTSWSLILSLFLLVDDIWTRDCIQSGLSSGEGLISGVRDPIESQQPVRENKRIVGYENVQIDSGVSDKRLLIQESEFARVLKVLARDGNTLSAIIRDAWDKGDLRVLTRTNSLRATNAHISIIAHITNDELRRNLEQTETANGFANRFLWIFAKRSKCLPDGGNLMSGELDSLIARLKSAITFAQNVSEIRRDDKARLLWQEIYPKLSDGNIGLFGAVTSRAEAQVTRLSCIYALLDQSENVRHEHLKAALALWRYCEDSARYIFGEGTGDKIADLVLEALRDAGNRGLSRTEISSLFARNVSAVRLNISLKNMIEQGCIQSHKEKSDNPNAKRQIERYFAANR